MSGLHCKLDRFDGFVSGRNCSLCQNVFAIVQSLEGKDGISGISTVNHDINFVAIAQDLLQREGGTCKRITVFIDLVDDRFVGEGDHVVFLAVIGIFAGLSVFIQARIAAVLKVAAIDITLVTDVGGFVEGCGEEYFYDGTVEALIRDGLFAFASPGQGYVEFVVTFILCDDGALDLVSTGIHNTCIIIICKCRLHLIMEGDVILTIAGNILRQGSGQLVRYGVADIIVCGILPVGGFTGAVVGILDLLLEGRLVGSVGIFKNGYF